MDLVLYDEKFYDDIIKYNEQHSLMMESIREYSPTIYKDTKNFNKSQSQFMDNFFTVSHPTPIRNIRQMLAEINKSRQALMESHFKLELVKLEIEKLERKLEAETDDLERRILLVKIDKKKNQIFQTEQYQEGAIRKIANYVEQMKSIKKSYGIDEFDEIDFEKEEEKYHIMKAFDQGLCAARAHGGTIDEGNHIYFSQIGVNGALAQHYVTQFLHAEREIIARNEYPSPNLVHNFLLEMAKVFSGCSKFIMEQKGMSEYEDALLKNKLTEKENG